MNTSFTRSVPAARAPAFLPCLDGARLGLGGAALGNLYQPVTDAQVRTLLDAAWDDGCRCFDTAPHYGHGLSERRMGDALRQHPRAAFSLSSKTGRLLTPEGHAAADQHGYVQTLPFVQHWDFSASGMRRSVEDSLQRLGLACLDAVFIHDMDAHTQGERAQAVFRQVMDASLPTLMQLKAEGLLRHVGLGVNDHAVVSRVLQHADLDALLLAGRYTLLDTSALSELMPQLQRRGVALALGGVFNSGMLATRIDAARSLTFNYAPAQQAWIDKALHLQAVCDRHGVPIEAAALQFALHHPATALVLLGPRSVQEWRHAREAARQPIPAGLWQELRHEHLLPEEAPTP
ncbi:MAG: aldo/keto reductase [Limnohabitans sp.]